MTVKGIAIRVIIVLLSLFGMNKVYSVLFYEEDLQKFAPIINEIRAIPHSAKILYIGESSNITSHRSDPDKRPISALIGRHYPEGLVTHLTQPAGHLGIFYAMLQAVDPKTEIETVVLTVNLRSFNAEWKNSQLESNLQKSAIMIGPEAPLYKRFLLSFKAYSNESDAIRERIIHEHWKAHKLDVSTNFPYKYMLDWRDAYEKSHISNKSLGAEFITTYAFSINEFDERFNELDKIIDLADKRGWKLLVNILPENIESAEGFVGTELVSLMEKNVAVITEYLTQKNVPFVNLNKTLPNKYFMDKEWPTEHYVYEGRKIIADQLAAALSKWYPDQYIEVPNERQKNRTFINDCEGNEYWANMQTISFEKSHSGIRSSKTGIKDEFSINFEYLYPLIPKDAKNEVVVEFYTTTEKYTDDMMLVLDATLSDGQRIWKSKSLKELANSNSKWQLLKWKWELGKDFANCERINVFIYNLSKKDLFIDDLKVEFH